MSYTVLDVEAIAVAYHYLLEEQKKLLELNESNDWLVRKDCVVRMRKRIKEYEEITNDEVRKQFHGRGANLKFLEAMCQKLILESSETIRQK